MTQPTAVYSTRTDLRVLAAIAEYWQNQGITFTSISQLHRKSIEIFAEILNQRGMVKTYSTTAEAKNYLEHLGLFKSLSQRNRATLISQMQTEELISQGLDPSYIEKKTSSTIAPDQLERAQEILRRKLDGDTDGGQILGPEFGSEEKE